MAYKECQVLYYHDLIISWQYHNEADSIIALPHPFLNGIEPCFSATWTWSERLVHPEKSCILPPPPIHLWGNVGGRGSDTIESGKRALCLQGGISYLLLIWLFSGIEIHLKVSTKVWPQHMLLISHCKRTMKAKGEHQGFMELHHLFSSENKIKWVLKQSELELKRHLYNIVNVLAATELKP